MNLMMSKHVWQASERFARQELRHGAQGTVIMAWRLQQMADALVVRVVPLYQGEDAPTVSSAEAPDARSARAARAGRGRTLAWRYSRAHM